jgi:hypothetical protein
MMLPIRPGFRTSEFLVALLAVVGSIVADVQDYISNADAAHLSIAGAVAFVISRGLAKTEPRNPPTPPAG